MLVFASADEIRATLGTDLGAGPWVTIDQAMIDRFAAATDDFQWIHVDAERAARESPYGRTVAHGHLTLSLIPRFLSAVRQIEGTRLTVNYGLDRVRFPAPVPVDSRLRGRVRVAACADAGPGALRTTYGVTVEIEGGEKPACVAEAIAIHYWP